MLRSKLKGSNIISFNDVLIDIFALKLITTQKKVIVEHKRIFLLRKLMWLLFIIDFNVK